ncbi:hypothetical protein [[Clostridium] innocuum]|uniref:hypothetical protein n=1 Tax=Clostridium innocuum TaxID=1522 RepID=UPI0032D3E803
MKALIRCFMFGMSIIVLIMMFSFFQEVNVRQDELNNIVATAMTQTQTVIKEQIEDKQYKTNNKRYAISNNDEYVAEFTHNLYMLKTTNSDYHITVYGVDYEKGLLDIGVESSFRMWNGQTKTLTTRKTGIVENLDYHG